MKTLTSRFFAVALAVGSCVALSPSCDALGFRNPDQGGRATAQGEAFVAQADDASAIWYNAAGLTQLDGTQFTSGLYLNYVDAEFHSSLGFGDFEPLDRPVVLPHMYMSTDLGMERWRFGLGLNSPFGNAVDWPETAPFRYSVISSSLRVFNLQPTVAYRVTDWLSVGAGLNYFIGDTEFYRALPAGFPPLFLPAEGRFKYEARGDGFGFNFGLMLRPHEKHSFGLTYRSQVNMDFNHDNHVDVSIPGFGTVLSTSASSELDLPQSVAFGYAFKPTEKLKLEFDAEWTNWNTLDTVTLSSPHPLVNGQAVAFNWLNSMFYEFGVQYALSESWMLRGGYIFSENTVPDATFSATLPDNDRHVFSIGAGYTKGRISVDVAYQYSLTEDRTITVPPQGDPGLLGTWESQSHALMLTSTIRF